jgi:hypothetical protein
MGEMGVQQSLEEPVTQQGPARESPAATPEFHFWSGASGKRYVHTVYDLLDCPRLPASSYVLVKRAPSGRRDAVRIGQLNAEAWSLNLAEVRHRAAQLGANEVHVHLIATDRLARNSIAADLQIGQFAELAAEPSTRPSLLS